MPKRLLIDALHPEEMRVAIADERQIMDFDFISVAKRQVKGNIYLAKITRVEPSLQAAFVEYGGGKQGFLPFAEIHPDYYQIPISDRKRLLEEAERDDTVEAENAPPSHTAGVEATLGEAPAFEQGPGYEGMESAENSDTDDSSGAPENALPALEAIPELSPTSEGEEETSEISESAGPQTGPSAAPVPAKRTIEFAQSEIVAQEMLENEQLSGQLNGSASSTGEAKEEEGVETLSGDEEEISSQRKRNLFFRRYKIQEVIKRGQIVLVQVIKEERGNKGVSLTSFLSLAGRYCVLMPNSPRDGGVSRKINDGDTRRRLKEVMSELKLARGMSVIIRTAGIDRTRAEIRRDFEYLVKLWNKIRETTLGSTAPSLIYEESDLIKRSIRDLYANDIEEVVVEGDEAYESARDFMNMLLPTHTPRVKHYSDSLPIFYAYGIEDQLLSMHDPVVKLRSGGYIVLSPTEALISIDVNSGRSTSERNIEETATKTNLEAAAEIARQLRLRDLAGLIVIDFIDMMESRNRRNVERALKDALKNDRAKIQLGRISPFGLLEMSRQRLRPSIAEANMIPCPHCAGRGHVRSQESMSIQVIRSLEKEAAGGSWQILKLNVSEQVALHLLNTKRTLLTQIEERSGVQVQVVIDQTLSAAAFTIERTRRNSQQQRQGWRDDYRGRESVPEAVTGNAEPVENSALPETENAPRRDRGERGDRGGEQGGERGGRRRGRRGGRNRPRNDRPPREYTPHTGQNEEVPPMAELPGNGETADTGAPEESRPPREQGERGSRGRRGGRGRRRWRDDEKPERNGNIAEGGEHDQRSQQDNVPQQARESSGDAETLPHFTRRPVVEPITVREQPTQPSVPVRQAQQPEITSRPQGQPPRKGWWQKIIELE